MLQCVHLLFKNHIYVIHTYIHTYIHRYVHDSTSHHRALLSSVEFRRANQNRPVHRHHGGSARGGAHAQHIHAGPSSACGGTVCMCMCIWYQ